VSLPTGGGKTRVTVEASVRLVLAPEGDRRSVIWVAQTDELCEQAVQAFRQVWVNLGAQRMELRIVRLWGGNPNPPLQAPDRPVAVVASIQTLNFATVRHRTVRSKGCLSNKTALAMVFKLAEGASLRKIMGFRQQK
jgi:superfamily II DNA or RNA helicase